MELPKALAEKRDAFVVTHRQGCNYDECSCFTDGFNACYAEMQEREKKLAEALKGVLGDLETAAQIKCEPLNPQWYYLNLARTTLKDLGIK